MAKALTGPRRPLTQESFTPVYSRRLCGVLGWATTEAHAYLYLVQHQGTPELGRRLRKSELESGYESRPVLSSELRSVHGWSRGQLARATERLRDRIPCPHCEDAHALVQQIDRGEGRPSGYGLFRCSDAPNRMSIDAYRTYERGLVGSSSMPRKSVDSETCARLVEVLAASCDIDLPASALAALAERSAHLFEAAYAELEARMVRVVVAAGASSTSATPELVDELLGDGRKRLAARAIDEIELETDESAPSSSGSCSEQPEYVHVSVQREPSFEPADTVEGVGAGSTLDLGLAELTIRAIVEAARGSAKPASAEKVQSLYFDEWLPRCTARLGDALRAQEAMAAALKLPRIVHHVNIVAALRNGFTERGDFNLLTPANPETQRGACEVVFNRKPVGLQRAALDIVRQFGADRKRLREIGMGSSQMIDYLLVRVSGAAGGLNTS